MGHLLFFLVSTHSTGSSDLFVAPIKAQNTEWMGATFKLEVKEPEAIPTECNHFQTITVTNAMHDIDLYHDGEDDHDHERDHDKNFKWQFNLLMIRLPFSGCGMFGQTLSTLTVGYFLFCLFCPECA